MSPAGTSGVLRGVADPGPAGDLFLDAIRQALAISLHNVFLLGATLQVLAVFILLVLLRDAPEPSSADRTSDEA